VPSSEAGRPLLGRGAVRHGADASHELRTPLTSVRGLAEFSLQQGEAAAREELIRLMTRIQQEAYGWDCWSRICCSPS
jgi:signal transduction histidine kinase